MEGHREEFPVKPKLMGRIKSSIGSYLNDKYNLAFIALLIVAIHLRRVFRLGDAIWNDAAVHLWHGMKVSRSFLFWFSSEFLLSEYIPLNLLKGALYLITDDILLSAKIVAFIFDMLGIIFIYLLASELRDKKVGLMAAVFLTFHHMYSFISISIIADGPLATMYLIVGYCVVKLYKERNIFWGLFVAASILVTLALKQQGILLLISLIIYLAWYTRLQMFKNWALLISWLIPVGFMLIVQFVGITFLNENILRAFFITVFRFAGMAKFDTMAQLPFVWTWEVIILVVIGVIISLIYKLKRFQFITISLVVYLLFFEVNIVTLRRYIVPIVPFALILTAFAVMEIIGFIVAFFPKVNKIYLIIPTVLIIILPFYGLLDSLIATKSYTYTGHPEAGQWIKDNAEPNAIYFAGSPRMQRPFSDRDYGGPGVWDRGGTLWNLRSERYVNNRTLFEEDLLRLAQTRPVYVEIDKWEFTQPAWYYQISDESLDYFYNLGFKLVYRVHRIAPHDDNVLRKVPVIYLLKYNPNA